MSRPSRLPQLVAHRGNAHEFPENTLAALRSAIELGARFLELDVQLSRDHVPMVVHDIELTRTAGRPGSVFDMRASELVRVEVCEPQRFGDRFSELNMPRLADAIGLLENRPQVTLFVELKRESLTRFGHDVVLPRVLETLRPFRSQCVLVSFDLPAIFHARQIGGHRVGWVLASHDDHARLKCEALAPDFLFCDLALLPRTGALWRGPWSWVIYEVEDGETALALGARGAAFVESMRVRALVRALQPDGQR